MRNEDEVLSPSLMRNEDTDPRLNPDLPGEPRPIARIRQEAHAMANRIGAKGSALSLSHGDKNLLSALGYVSPWNNHVRTRVCDAGARTPEAAAVAATRV